MGCDIWQYLPEEDEPEDWIETLVHKQKRWSPSRPSFPRRRKVLPKGAVDSVVVTADGEQLQFVAYVEKGRNFIAELYFGETLLRSMHTHYGHRNPDSSGPFPDGHIHFPTVQYPLVVRGRSYAYEMLLPEDTEFVQFLQDFAAVINLDFPVTQLSL